MKGGKKRGPLARPRRPEPGCGFSRALAAVCACWKAKREGRARRPSLRIPGWIRQRRVLLRLGRAARVASSPTLARRFPVGPGDRASTRWYLHCPYCLKSLPDHLLSAVDETIAKASATARRR